MIKDWGHPDEYRGYYDTRGCGTCSDYCRWVGEAGSGGDPTVRTKYTRSDSKESRWACELPHIKYLDWPDYRVDPGSWRDGIFLYRRCKDENGVEISQTGNN